MLDSLHTSRYSLPYTAANANSQAYITPDSSKPAILRNYDGAGRVIGVQNPDNTRVGYDYNWLQCVGTWDEVDDRKYECHDMQGRLDYTQEEDWTAYSSAPHYLWTDYSYDALDRLTGVVRDSNGPNQTSSSIGYDGLGRNPRTRVERTTSATATATATTASTGCGRRAFRAAQPSSRNTGGTTEISSPGWVHQFGRQNHDHPAVRQPERL